MIEYPHVIGVRKAPREECVAFDKIDGSNLRFKWTSKKSFHVFGTRTQLIGEQTEFWGEAVTWFKNNMADALHKHFASDRDMLNKEAIVYAEWHGPRSFAGRHEKDDEKKLTVFDVLIFSKGNGVFLKPREFVKQIGPIVPIPAIIYEGNLNDSFITSVRNNDLPFKLNEGVVCKGTQTNGAFRGKMWMCKIKTNDYLDRLRKMFGEEGVKKYGEE